MDPTRPPHPHARLLACAGRRFVRTAVLAGAAAWLLAGCQTPPPATPPVAVPAPPPPEPEAPPPPPSPAPVPAGPAAQQQAQKAAVAAAELLEAGKEDAGRAELKRALGLDAQNRLALNLTRQLGSDPVAVLGGESFNYTVRPGETLSKLAERFLQGDRYAFVILARYNGIAVPKQVGVGQVLKIPGRPRPGSTAPASTPPPVAGRGEPPTPPAPPEKPPEKPREAVVVAQAPPLPPPPLAAAEPAPGDKAMRSAQAAERNGDLATARIDYLSAAASGQAGAAAKAGQLGRQLVQRYGVAAKSALARQDLDGSIANWQRVLDIEPAHATARSEIERMKELKVKLGNLK